MPSDPNIYANVGNPSVQLLTPLQRNSLALQNQSLQGGAMTLQQQQLEMQSQAAIRAAIINQATGGTPAGVPPPQAAPAPPSGPVDPLTGTAGGASPVPPPVSPMVAGVPAGTPPPQAAPAPVVPARPAVPSLQYLVSKGASVADATTLRANLLKTSETSANIDKANAEALKSTNEANDLIRQQQSDMATGLLQATPPGQPVNADLLNWHLQQYGSLGPQQAQHAQQVGQHLSQMAPADQVAFLKSIANTPKTIEAGAAAQTAQSKTDAQTREAADDADKRGLAMLGSTKTDPKAYATVLNALGPAFLARNPGLDSAANATPASAGKAQQMGLTSQEQVTTAAQAARDANTAKNEAANTNLRKIEVGYQGAKLVVDRLNAGLDAQGNPITAANANPTAVALAGGKLDPVTARAMLRKNPGLINQAIAVDPAFDESKLESRFAFNKRLTDYSPTEIGGQALALNKLVHHAGLLYDTIDALNNGTLVPGNAIYNKIATTFGSAPTGNFNIVRDFVSHESAKLAQGGAPNESDIKENAKNMNSAGSPDQLKQGLDKILQIGGGGMQAINEQGRTYGMGQNFTVLGKEGAAIMQQHGIDPATLKPSASAAASVSQFKAGDSVMYNGAPHKVLGYGKNGKLLLDGSN
jgi:hypothetical protein